MNDLIYVSSVCYARYNCNTFPKIFFERTFTKSVEITLLVPEKQIKCVQRQERIGFDSYSRSVHYKWI
jgi:hypothetical protein